MRILGAMTVAAATLAAAGAFAGGASVWAQSGAGSPRVELRTWRDDGAQHETSAALVRSLGSRVVLRRPDGTEFEVPYRRLSADDRRYVDEKSQAISPAGPVGAGEAHMVVMLSANPGRDSVATATVVDEDEAFRYL